MNPSEIYILIGCEESQAICIEFRKLGFSAFSCDLKPCSGGHPEWHIQGDVFEAVKSREWHLAIFHPVCTYLTVTANKWLKDQPERASGALVGEARREAIEFFIKLTECDVPRICLENPVGCMSSEWRKPDQIIQPMMFGHKEPKKTCLWIKNLPLLTSTSKLVKPEYTITKSGKRMATWYYFAEKIKDNPEHRAEIRSKTFSGIAEAMAFQYGNFILNEYSATLF